MVFASQRWLGVRLDCLSALLTAATALASVIVSQDAGNYTCICNQQINPCLYELLKFLRTHESPSKAFTSCTNLKICLPT